MNSSPIIRTSAHCAGALAALLLLSTGCTGEIKSTWSGDPQDAYLDPENPEELIVPGKPPIKNPMIDQDMGSGGEVTPEEITRTAPYVRRLTQLQYHNTVRLALGDFLTPADMPEFGDAIPTINFSNNPNFLTISDTNVTPLYESAQTIAGRSVTEHAGLSSCVAASDEACFEQLIGELGEKLWRRPMSATEIQDLNDARRQVAAAGGTRAEQAEFIVQGLLLNVNTFYRTEVGNMAEVTGDEVIELDDYELAQALSYTLWNEPPDAELLQVAAAGQLTEPDIYRAQVQRLVQDPRVASGITEFFADYLKLDKLFIKEKAPALGLNDNAKAALVSGIREDLRTTFGMPDSSLLDPFSATNFSVNADSATFFGVEVTSSNFEQVAMDPTERYGILTHPAFLSVHSGRQDSNLIKRGVFTLEQLLCQHLDPAPAEIPAVPPEDLPDDFDPNVITTREALQIQHTSQAQCFGCHVNIDPAGYGYENYDGSGRWRLTEKENVTIDASGELTIKSTGEILRYADSVGYAQALRNSDSLRSCLTLQFMSYVLGEAPSDAEHQAFLEAFNTNEGNLAASLETVLMTPSFATRQISQEQ